MKIKATVVMTNDYPHCILYGTEKENKAVIKKIEKEKNLGLGYTRVYVRGYEFEFDVDFEISIRKSRDQNNV